MASIAYQNVLCQTQPPETSFTGTVEPDDTLVRKFYPKAKQMIVTGDYLRRKWQPLCGPRFYALIKAIRGYCSYTIKEGEALCYPSEETLARACGVTRRTIINWLVRVRPGEEEKFPGKRWAISATSDMAMPCSSSCGLCLSCAMIRSANAASRRFITISSAWMTRLSPKI